jgi:hypothetical protein
MKSVLRSPLMSRTKADSENIYYGPPMDALYCGRGGQKLKDSRFTVYGWLEPGDLIPPRASLPPRAETYAGAPLRPSLP